ncbi:protein phosphatase 1 regulatory subunit 7-like [Xenia sp. Carnegie-2017]|uniref:protein phosphatase 1 regulatory subunit 7-like n=1 Tax=Xenia sp. Carnegie-2017 TaxID=2897299 RepID=UPI001F048649|nr:protein phosphatase 1 regulatory subunit 7-like [Xenia sp. Carnegie-2017]
MATAESQAETAIFEKHNKRNLFTTTKDDKIPSWNDLEYSKQKKSPTMREEVGSERIYEVNLHASEIVKIDNFEKFPKLRCLDLSCNQIEVIEALDKNVELRVLKLYSNKIKNIERLETLKELCNLQLQDNELSYIGDGLHTSKKLKSLRLDCNIIQSISMSEISACSKLTYLNVSSNSLSDISFINCLLHLEEFYASHNKISIIPNLGRCKKLEELDISHNKLSSAVKLQSLPSIRVLHLEYNKICDFNTSRPVPTLEQLYLGNNKIGSIKEVPSMFPSLEVLDVQSNNLDNLDELTLPLSQCIHLQELTIIGNPCYDSITFDHESLSMLLPNLELLNGVSTKQPQSSQSKTQPPMRPMSETNLVSIGLLEEQISATIHCQDTFQSNIATKFGLVYDLLKKLPKTLSSDIGFSNQVVDGDRKLTKHFINERTGNQSLPGSNDYSEQVSINNKSSVQNRRPSSQCSNRTRIEDAIMFAKQHFDK